MKEELIGRKTKVEYAGKTFFGTIIDETKNTLVLETDKKRVRIIKKNSAIEIGGRVIPGSSIAKRPEERIKG